MTRREDPNSSGLRLSGASRDEASTVSEALRRAVADLVLETTVEGIWLLDAEARTTFVNCRITDLLGYTEDEMIGRPVFDFLDRERWPTAERNLKLRAEGVEDRQEVQVIRKDGTRVLMLGSANPVCSTGTETTPAPSRWWVICRLRRRKSSPCRPKSPICERIAARAREAGGRYY